MKRPVAEPTVAELLPLAVGAEQDVLRGRVGGGQKRAARGRAVGDGQRKLRMRQRCFAGVECVQRNSPSQRSARFL
jgi:hypothetical protein